MHSATSVKRTKCSQQHCLYGIDCHSRSNVKLLRWLACRLRCTTTAATAAATAAAAAAATAAATTTTTTTTTNTTTTTTTTTTTAAAAAAAAATATVEVGHYTAGLQILWYEDYDLNYTQNIEYLYTSKEMWTVIQHSTLTHKSTVHDFEV